MKPIIKEPNCTVENYGCICAFELKFVFTLVDVSSITCFGEANGSAQTHWTVSPRVRASISARSRVCGMLEESRTWRAN